MRSKLVVKERNAYFSLHYSDYVRDIWYYLVAGSIILNLPAQSLIMALRCHSKINQETAEIKRKESCVRGQRRTFRAEVNDSDNYILSVFHHHSQLPVKPGLDIFSWQMIKAAGDPLMPLLTNWCQALNKTRAGH